jgi:hypothetical protein
MWVDLGWGFYENDLLFINNCPSAEARGNSGFLL